MRSVVAVRVAIASLAAAGHRATLAAIAQASRALPEEAVSSEAASSAGEARRVRRLDRRSKRELAAMAIRLERKVETLQRHNANLRGPLLRNGFGRSGRFETEPATA